MSQSILKDTLCQFLKAEEKIVYPVIETRILSLSPLEITDDNKRFIDLSNLEDRVTEELDGKLELGQKLVLQDWKYVLRRIPNSHEYYFDISVAKYKLLSEFITDKPAEGLIKMEDDIEIRYLFESRKRTEIEKMLKGQKDAPSRTSQGSIKSPVKDTQTLGETTVPSQKISTVKGHGASSKEYSKTLAKPSVAKTEDLQNPINLETSFFRKAGVLSAVSKVEMEEAIFLTIAELMSVPAFMPCIKRSVVRPVPLIRLRRSTSSDSQNLEELQRESIQRIVQRYSSETSSRSKYNFDFEDIMTQLRKGNLDWDQLVFGKKVLDHLKRNKILIEQATD